MNYIINVTLIPVSNLLKLIQRKKVQPNLTDKDIFDRLNDIV